MENKNVLIENESEEQKKNNLTNDETIEVISVDNLENENSKEETVNDTMNDNAESIGDSNNIENNEKTAIKDNLNLKALRKMNEYYEKKCNELLAENNPENQEKIEAIKKELEKNNEILNSVGVNEEKQEEPEKIKVQKEEIQEVTIKKEEPKKEEKQTQKEEKLVIILDCLRGEYLIRKSDLVEFKAYEVKTKLLDNRNSRKEYLDYLHDKFGNFETDEIDITLCKALEEYFEASKFEEVTKKYIDAVYDLDKEKLPFKLVYNFNGLKELRKEGFLSRSASNKLLTVSKFYEENNLADVQKEEKGFKRVINNFKKFFSKREFKGNIDLLNEGEKSRKVKILFKDGTYSLECGNTKGKKFGDIYMYEAKCKIDDDDEIDKIEELYDLRLSNKDVSRIDLTIYRLLRKFEDLNCRVEDRELNGLAESYVRAIISKEIPFDVENFLDITYDLGCFEDISEEALSDYELKQIEKKSKYARKIGLAKIEYSEKTIEPSRELKRQMKKKEYFCKITDESDLDEDNKKAIDKLESLIKEKNAEKKEDELSIVEALAKENNIALKFNNIKKNLLELKYEIVNKIIKEGKV